jgi:hypothetical protein
MPHRASYQSWLNEHYPLSRSLGTSYASPSLILYFYPQLLQATFILSLFLSGFGKIHSAYLVLKPAGPGVTGILRVGIHNSVTYKDVMPAFEQWNQPVDLFEYYKPEAQA